LKDLGAVRLCEDRFLERAADLAPVYVKRRDELDIAAAITADGVAHNTIEYSGLAIAVVFDTLHQGTGAIADAGNGYFNLVLHR